MDAQILKNFIMQSQGGLRTWFCFVPFISKKSIQPHRHSVNCYLKGRNQRYHVNTLCFQILPSYKCYDYTTAKNTVVWQHVESRHLKQSLWNCSWYKKKQKRLLRNGLMGTQIFNDKNLSQTRVPWENYQLFQRPACVLMVSLPPCIHWFKKIWFMRCSAGWENEG